MVCAKLLLQVSTKSIETSQLTSQRCGNVASVLNLNENGEQVYKTFEAAPQVS